MNEQKDCWVSMHANQLPVMINNATTSHKLQGASVDNIFVHEWSKLTNWSYVLLSHVRTMSGLFMRSKLLEDLDCYRVPVELTLMMNVITQSEINFINEEDLPSIVYLDEQGVECIDDEHYLAFLEPQVNFD